jgi:membrane-bound metal-dependent hydrolase YbcI (DUF457 family)
VTQFGHIIIGISFGTLCIPSKFNIRRKILFLLPFAFVANIPDIAIGGWGHDKYHFSHSIFVNFSFICLLFVVWMFLSSLFRWKRHLGIAAGISCAWLSHLLLDSFYNHGRGIKIFWPVSDSALRFPIPWLNIKDISISYFSWYNTKIYLIEVFTFTPILIFCLLLHYLYAGRNNRKV